MTDQELKDKILLDMHKDVGVIKETIAAIRVDVATHIKRSHMLETKIETLEKYFWMMNGATATVTVLLAAAKYIFKVI